MSGAQDYLAARAAVAGEFPGRDLPWLQAQRRAALARFDSVGFPGRRDEDWKYTNIAPLAKQIAAQKFRLAEQKIISEPLSLAPLVWWSARSKSHLMVFSDGLFSADHSCYGGAAEGVTVAPLATLLDEQPQLVADIYGTVAPADAHGFTALNAAHNRDGVAVIIAPGAKPTVPVEMLFINTGRAESVPRNLIIAGEDGRASVIERHVSLHDDDDSFTNSVTEIALEEGAQLDYHLIQAQSAAAHHICGVWARQARASRFSCRTVTVGGRLVRNDLGVELAGEEAHCDLFGLYAATGAQHVDNHTTIRHAAAHCTSCEIYKGVLDRRARAVFHGRVKVAQGAQKTDATQTNNNLLLSRGAEIDTKPQLEIYADDVKCAHGATVGQLDADALFYLRARGVDEAEARRMLTFAFANDILGKIAHNELQDALVELLHARLGDGVDGNNGNGNNGDARGEL